jgi:hypothetical protein
VPFSHIQSDASVILLVKAGGRPQRDRYLLINDAIWRELEGCWDVEPNLRPPATALSSFFAANASV